ncbi:MAG: hypothetical protein K6G12_08740 [Lachnospiraceae bacterium]|nr:hypothetical protein [Lachnospiraceae bacterium]
MENKEEKTTEINTEDKIPKKHRKPRSYKTGWMKLIQHILITVAVLATVLYMAGSYVAIKDYNGSEIYHISASDKGRNFEDSVFFNSVFGREVSDVLRYVTIRSQMETGGSYDSDKIIDIDAYNTRQSSIGSLNGVTANYYLGDLIKWSKYGYETVESNVSAETISGNFIDHSSYSEETDGVDPQAVDETDASGLIVRDMLVNRYRTADGLTLEESADTWEEYDVLVSKLTECADSLHINYEEYLKFNDYFDPLNSNIRYCVITGEGSDRAVYTNAKIKTTDTDKIGSIFKTYGKYIIYDPDRMVYDTNTAITESTFNNLFDQYKYAYGDDSYIYIAADMSLPANDALKDANNGFTATYLPDRNQTFAIIALCIIGYLTLLVVCTMKEGNYIDENR